ncbi:MAG: hypothetical protein M3082_18955 [Candidatus Dormibacteraeota bacterium]|nr:hypothetical protein [Candidatus Dormibacteraeota bacterium]
MFKRLLGLVVFAAFVPVSALAATPGTWVPAGHLLYAGFHSAPLATAGKDGLIYSMGSDFEAYNPATRKSAGLPHPPLSASGFCLVTGVAGKIHALGSLIAAYSPTKGTWIMEAYPPALVFDPTCAVGANGLLYVFDAGKADYRYDPYANTWTTLASTPPNDAGPAVLGPDGNIYIVGCALYAYHPITDSWTAGAPMDTCPESATIGPDGRLYADIWGSTVMEVYDFATASWSRMAGPPNYGKLATAAGHLYSLGGTNAKTGRFGTQVFKQT